MTKLRTVSLPKTSSTHDYRESLTLVEIVLTLIWLQMIDVFHKRTPFPEISLLFPDRA